MTLGQLQLVTGNVSVGIKAPRMRHTAVGSSTVQGARHAQMSHHKAVLGSDSDVQCLQWTLALKECDCGTRCVLHTGPCKAWAERYCEEVEAGEGAMAECLSQVQVTTDSRDTEGGRGERQPCLGRGDHLMRLC